MEVKEKSAAKLILQHRPLENWFAAAACAIALPLLLLSLGARLTWLFYIPWFPLLPLFLVILGLAIALLAGQVITYIFDKSENQVICKQQGLLGSKTSEQLLLDIIDVQVENTSWNSGDNISGQIVLIFKGGKTLALASRRGETWRSQQITLGLIREFLGLPPLKL